MLRALVWGVGKKCDIVLNTIKNESCKIVGFIDNDPEKIGNTYKNEMIYSWNGIPKDYDYLIVAVLSYKAVVYQLEQAGFDMEKLIVFFNESYLEKKKKFDFIDSQAWEIAILKEKIGMLEKIMCTRFANMGYEIVDRDRQQKYRYPYIANNEELVEKITDEHCSFIRFGDGEFEIMRGKERAPFQRVEEELSRRLREVVLTDQPQILLGIADNYGDLECYTQETAQGIREYMTEETRAFHLSVLDTGRTYYNAYVFKTYMPYRDKENTKERISLIRRIWNDRDIVFIEGDKTRTGYGNDLFDNAKSIKRVLCPTFNAYSKYNEILACGKKLDKDCLILVALGPAGKILAYDLIQAGYQVVDIGQVDMDYEWYLSGAGFRVPNPNKYVSQLPPTAVNEIIDTVYASQILFKVE